MIRHPNQIQKRFTQAIDQYTDRKDISPGEQGSTDIKTLQQIGVSNICEVFKSSLSNGLTSSQALQNEKMFGKNEYAKRKKRTLWQILKQSLHDQLLIILMVAAAVSVVVEYFAGQDKSTFWTDGVAIMSAVVVCTLVSTISNYRKQKQFDELDQMTQNTYNYEVLRDGKRQEIHRSEIVCGDMIFISNGLEVPADCILYRAVNVVVNESAITGETNEVYKNVLDKCLQQKMDAYCPSPLMISGSNIVSGQGIMMAVVVGKQSKAGKNFQLLFSKEEQQEQQQTPLQKQLEKLARQIGRLAIISSIFIFVVLVARLLIQELPKGNFNFGKNLQKFIQYLTISIAVVVVLIPEGLPLAITLTLAYSMRAMYNDKILVRKLESCETMGAATFLCSDKTGTITQNKMNVMHVVNLDSFPVEHFHKNGLHQDYHRKLTHAMFHNTSAITDPEKGAQTEIALIKLARTLTGGNEEEMRKLVGPEGYFKRLPFDSSRKRMTTGMRVNNQDLLFMNGASQQILEACQAIQHYRTNQIVYITPQIKAMLLQEIEKMARRGCRTVSIAYKLVDGQAVSRQIKKYNREQDVLQQIEKSGFILLGIFGIEDPPREQSREAIQNCKRAGIHVIMVTGDNKITASNIAEQVGITKQGKGKILEASQVMKLLEQKGLLKEQSTKVDKKGNVIEEEGLSKKMKKIVLENQADEQAFEQILQDLVVMARSKPEHKYILVDGINKLGHVVGVTGDGANDAPALMRADIGLAMGITGTQVAKNASDIVILDDNFNSIVRAVVWGRNVYTSIRRFLQFQLTINIIAVTLVLISSAAIRQSVLGSVQMLWVNLCMDTLAALALATEPPNQQELLNQQPNSPNEKLVTRTMLKHIIGQALFQLIVLLLILFFGPRFIPQVRDEFDDRIGSDLQAKYYNGIAESTIADGRFYQVSGQDLYRKWFQKYRVYSRHYTFIFNTFVFLQIFNFFCCRRIKDELNFFSRIGSSILFWAMVILIIALQYLVITFGDRFFQLYEYGGLSPVQWLISIGIGALTLPVSFFLRLLPFCKPEENRHAKRQSHRTKMTKQKQKSVKDLKSVRKPFIKSVKSYDEHSLYDYSYRRKASLKQKEREMNYNDIQTPVNHNASSYYQGNHEATRTSAFGQPHYGQRNQYYNPFNGVR